MRIIKENIGIVLAVVISLVGISLYITLRPGVVSKQAFNPIEATISLNNQEFRLQNGVAEIEIVGSSLKHRVEVFGEPKLGDLNNDGREDAAMMLVENPGGSGSFYYVVAILNKEFGMEATAAVLLGDRIAPQNIDVQSRMILANYADRNPGEPMSAKPSLGKSKLLFVDGLALQEAVVANFGCDDDRFVLATFYPGKDDKAQLFLSDGRKVSVPKAISASGARYASPDESFVFWNKGDTAFVQESGETTFANCILEK